MGAGLVGDAFDRLCSAGPKPFDVGSGRISMRPTFHLAKAQVLALVAT